MRRQICTVLSQADPPRTVRDLAVELGARTLAVEASAVTAEQRRHHQIRLHHHQLPKLADYGLVSYNRSRRAVTITPHGVDTLAAVTDTRAGSSL